MSDATNTISNHLPTEVAAAATALEQSGTALTLEENLELTATEVRSIIGHPIDTWAVAAALESLGYRDIDAVDQFNKANVFELASDIRSRMLGTADRLHRKQGEQKRRKRGVDGFRRLAKSYGKGAVTAMPMMGQIACILVLRYSLWAWVDFTEAQATIVALGTLLSFIVTGGYIQSIGREGIRLVGSENYFLAEKVCWKLVEQGG